MKKTPAILLLMTACAVFSIPAWAEKADRNKVMNLEADSMRYDDVKQLTVFNGNVVMTKGTILVRAAHIDVRQDADGNQFGIITGTPEKRAFFRQKREALDEYFEVESERIDYDGRADVVKFTGKALLRRLRGEVLADEITGAVIVYENLTDNLSVDGSSAKIGNVPAPAGRIRAMLTPKPEADAPSKTPNPGLRSTTTLGSTPQ